MRRLAFVLFTVTSVACQYDPFTHEYTSVKPDADKLAGVYQLDERSLAMLRNRYKLTPPASRFVLQTDGTFTITDVPTCWRADSECSAKVENASGTWKFAKQDEWWVVRLRCTSIQGKPTDYGLDAFVRGDRPPQLLHFTVGDPDSGEALAFRTSKS